MTPSPSIWSFVIHAGLVVKIVMLLLSGASISSWAIIIQRRRQLKATQKTLKTFQKQFWRSQNVRSFYDDLTQDKRQTPLARVFYAGFSEFLTMHQQHTPFDQMIRNTSRAMSVTRTREINKLEQHLSFLATVGSVSPYVGLLGTVWGIMTAFRGLGTAQQATIAMVAPGISEALIATAIGLFAAIPAVIAYNRFSDQVSRIDEDMQLFQEELTNVISRANRTTEGESA